MRNRDFAWGKDVLMADGQKKDMLYVTLRRVYYVFLRGNTLHVLKFFKIFEPK